MTNEDQENVWLVTMAPDKLVLRLPAKAKNVIFWLANARSNQAIECNVLVGKHGQLVIRPAEAKPSAFDEVEAQLQKNPPEFGDERRDWFEIARLSAASRPARIMIEQGGRASLYLPKALGIPPLGPSIGEKTVVVGLGAVLEIWTVPTWTTWHLKVGAAPEVAEQEAVDDLNA